MKIKLVFVLSFVIFSAAAENVSELELTADYTIDVPAGTTTDVARVSGGAYTITKTGGGVVRFGWIRNADAKLVVQEGGVDFYRPPKPPCLEDAFLHVDANVLDPAYVVTENGTNFVTRWTDASDGPHYAVVDRTTKGTWRTEETIGTPYVLEGYQNGLDVIDFGHYQDAKIVDAQGVSLVRGAAMNFDVPCKPVRDVFAVIGYREEIKTVYADYGCADASPLLSYTDSWCFLPGKLGSGVNPPLFNYWQPSVAQALYGEVYYDDYYKKGTAIGSASGSAGAKAVPDGLFYLNVRPLNLDGFPEDIRPQADNTGLNSFARDRSNIFGGVRIGEYIIFDERLSDADRIAVENYLRVKWFPLQQNFKSVSFTGEAALSHSSGGKQLVTRLSDGVDVTVSEGDVEVDVLRHTGAWIHLDASKASTMLMSEEDSRTYVTNWFDADGGARSASHYAKVNTWRSDPENRRPFLTAGIASNALPVVDFGYPQNEKLIDAEGKGAGYGAAMRFDASCTTVRETIVVAGDREEAPFITDTYPTPGNSASFIGGRLSGCVNFFRNAFESGKNPLVLNPWNGYTKSIWNYENGVAVDGVLQKAGASIRLPDSGLHLVNFRMTENGGVSGLAHDENYAYGGVRIGEALVFESELADDVREPIVKTLMTKWMEKPPHVYGCGKVDVASGCELTVPYAALAAEKLVLGGKVSAEKVSACEIEIVSDAAEVAGTLDLSAGGTVTLDADLYPDARAGDSIRIIAADAIVGDVADWTVKGALADKLVVKLSVGEDGIYAELFNRGFSIIVR